MSLGSEARPTRLNTDADVDLVSQMLNRLTVRYGTLFVASAGNSGPYIGSILEAPGSAAQALAVAASAKDWDVNHDDTQSGDSCAGWRHPASPTGADNDCDGGPGDQPPSVSSFSSRGPSGDLWLRPDVAAPGYNIVSAQAATGAPHRRRTTSTAAPGTIRCTRPRPGPRWRRPRRAGAAALLLDGYRQRYGTVAVRARPGSPACGRRRYASSAPRS